MLTAIRNAVLKIDPSEVSLEKRGFNCDDNCVGNQIRTIGESFLLGYHAALSSHSVESIANEIDLMPNELVGFGYEGAGMCLGLLDSISPIKRCRWTDLLRGRGAKHKYMLHVGYGWALARIPWRRRNLEKQIKRFDPLLRWLVVDGFGFHEGFFQWKKWLSQPRKSRATFNGYLSRAFDQGLGRSLWFIFGANIDRIQREILSFQEERRSDLWSGVGLAATYAGGINTTGLHRLAELSGDNRSCLAQGSVFAAEARVWAANVTSHTNSACAILCGLSADDAAHVARSTCVGINDHEGVPAYEQWRARIRETTEEAAVCLS